MGAVDIAQRDPACIIRNLMFVTKAVEDLVLARQGGAVVDGQLAVDDPDVEGER